MIEMRTPLSILNNQSESSDISEKIVMSALTTEYPMLPTNGNVILWQAGHSDISI